MEVRGWSGKSASAKIQVNTMVSIVKNMRCLMRDCAHTVTMATQTEGACQPHHCSSYHKMRSSGVTPHAIVR